jgi:hypothetical protein
MRLDQIALQLYTVRALAGADLAGTLRAVAAAGYRSVELAGLPDTAPEELARLLTETGLRPIASHEGIERLRMDPIGVADRLAKFSAATGPSFVDPSKRIAHGRQPAPVRGELRRAGWDIRGSRYPARVSNHDFEFAPLDGTTVWDVPRRAPGRDRTRARRLLGVGRRA